MTLLKEKPTVGLFGTCNDSLWRDYFLLLLDKDKFDWFNPVVDDWNEEAQINEEFHKDNDEVIVFVITPKMKGVYSIAEVVDLSYRKKENQNLFFCFLTHEKDSSGTTQLFDESQIKSLRAVANLLERKGVKTTESLVELAKFVNDLEF